MKRHVFVPSADRWVSIEGSVVRDLDGNQLGQIARDTEAGGWVYQPANCSWHDAPGADKQAEAVAALLRDPNCPAGGPNHFDRP